LLGFPLDLPEPEASVTTLRVFAEPKPIPLRMLLPDVGQLPKLYVGKLLPEPIERLTTHEVCVTHEPQA
jgi:hypothetical protein